MNDICKECHAYGGHSPLCGNQTLEDAKRNAKQYYEAWLRNEYRDSNSSGRLRKKLIFWQGKFNMVKQENNKLRRKLYKTLPSAYKRLFRRTK